MWLINVETMKLEPFIGSDIPRYAILSHTWEGDEEVSHQEFINPTPQTAQKRGFHKIRKACETAAMRQRLRYVWVDTCCIDKSSSAELSEAINSMFV